MSKQRRIEHKKAQTSQKRNRLLIQIGSLFFIIIVLGLMAFSNTNSSNDDVPQQAPDRLELDPVLTNGAD